MPPWDYMDNKVWESSEVMNELEKIYKKSNLQNTIRNVNDLGKATKGLADSATAAQEAMAGVAGTLAADDSLSKEEEKPKKKLKKKLKKKKASKSKKIKADLIIELKKLSQEAIDNQNYKLAYKTEKALESIKLED